MLTNALRLRVSDILLICLQSMPVIGYRRTSLVQVGAYCERLSQMCEREFWGFLDYQLKCQPVMIFHVL